MLDLQSPRWAELEHAYGAATDIPALLVRLREIPSSLGHAEPWFSLWSALAHQGDVYSASFAAVPHVVATFAQAPLSADASYLQFPAWVEICRVKRQVPIPQDLRTSYFESMARLPVLVGAASGRPWEPEFLACALAAVAAAKGHPEVAEAALELSSAAVAQQFLEWRLAQ
jgi:hypothetical protein